MNVTVLGAGASFPRPGGACSGFLFSDGDTNLWVDAGNGTFSRLIEQISLADLDALLLTHVHADHIADVLPLMYALALTANARNGALPVYSPIPVEKGVKIFLGGGSQEMFNRVFDIHTIDGPITVGSMRIEPFTTSHPVDCHGVRVLADGRCIVYTSDTAYYEGLADECRDADLLICEATYVDGITADPGVHMWAEEAGKVAASAGVKSLVLTHILPTVDPDQAVAEASTKYRGPIEAAIEGKRYSVE